VKFARWLETKCVVEKKPWYNLLVWVGCIEWSYVVLDTDLGLEKGHSQQSCLRKAIMIRTVSPKRRFGTPLIDAWDLD
jgi:hypothetical protein